uniref:MigA n=1 Tax=Legionella micdadei TaxID=451 RepID=Q6E8N6_LEGMI|nr:MigA [Legionella micdadei]
MTSVPFRFYNLGQNLLFRALQHRSFSAYGDAQKVGRLTQSRGFLASSDCFNQTKCKKSESLASLKLILRKYLLMLVVN